MKTKVTIAMPAHAVKRINDDPEAFRRHMANNGFPIENMETPPQFPERFQRAEATLNDVERMYRNGTATEEEVVAYIRAWNAVPGRFTQAVLYSGAIRNFNPETGGAAYRHLTEKFGIRW